LLVDLTKAFDTVSRDFLFASLLHQGYPPTTIHLIKLLHNQNTASININGYLTKPFPVGSGVRQGCPLAPYLFILAINSLLAHIQHSSLQGTLPSPASTTPVKIQAYADDLTIFLQNNNEVGEAHHLLTSFGKSPI
jgi:Reverse transcriptase (RNA-dependent DNA polymerase)